MPFKFNRSRSHSPKEGLLGATGGANIDTTSDIPPELPKSKPPMESGQPFEVLTAEVPFQEVQGVKLPQPVQAVIQSQSGGIYKIDKGDKLGRDLGAIPKQPEQQQNTQDIYEKMPDPLMGMLHKELQRIQTEQKKINQAMTQVAIKMNDHEGLITDMSKNIDETQEDLQQLDKEMSKLSSKSSSRESSRPATRNSSRANSRQPSREGSPTEQVLERTKKLLQTLEEEEEENKKAKAKTTKYQTITDVMRDKAIFSALPSLAEEKQEQYNLWLRTFLEEYKDFNLPSQLMIPVALRKLPLALRTTARDRKISNETELRIFLHENIFGGRSYEYAKGKFKESNQMSPSDTNYPELLRKIKDEQVPVLMSLQPALQNCSKETREHLENKEILEMMMAALTDTVIMAARNKGMDANWRDLFKSCNQVASARLTLTKSKGKQVAGISVDSKDTEKEETDEEKLHNKIKKLEEELEKLKKNKPKKKKYCSLHKNSSNHTTEECYVLKKKQEQTNKPHTQKKFILQANGKRNFCKYCVPNNVKLEVGCSHCWSHSDPAKAVDRNDCNACQYKTRIDSRPVTPNP